MMSLAAEQLVSNIRVRSELRDFGAWMTSEQRRIFLLCRRMLQDPDEADSATQDVFLKAYKAMTKAAESNLDELDNPGKWVTRIAVNTCLDRLRSKSWKVWQRRPAPADEEIILQMTSDGEPDAERLLFSRQIQHRLELALLKLSARQRAVFSLRHYESLALEEIADVLKLDVGTVKAHLFRALTKMREELKDLYESTRSQKR
jgi:RNA polymerase sigma-70 factor (ECF subfamily)